MTNGRFPTLGLPLWGLAAVLLVLVVLLAVLGLLSVQ